MERHMNVLCMYMFCALSFTLYSISHKICIQLFVLIWAIFILNGSMWVSHPYFSRFHQWVWGKHMIAPLPSKWSDITWALYCLISLANLLFVQKLLQANSKDTIKALLYWPVVLIIHSNPWILAQRDTKAERVSMLWCHHAWRILVKPTSANYNKIQQSINKA